MVDVGDLEVGVALIDELAERRHTVGEAVVGDAGTMTGATTLVVSVARAMTTPHGASPTLMVASTWFFAVSMTETVLLAPSVV